MASAFRQNCSSSSSFKPPRNPIFTIPDSPNPTSTTPPTTDTTAAAAADPNITPFTKSEQDLVLSRSSHLTRPEVIKRRLHNIKQLSKCYRDHYWALMEDLKVQYKDYYWNYGVSPFKDENLGLQSGIRERDGGHGVEGTDENVNNNCSNVVDRSDCDAMRNDSRCVFLGCKIKAMALTKFCYLHILSDSKQKLYTPCNYVIKSAQAGDITCGKPILRSTDPPHCNVHFQKAQKYITRALKKAGIGSQSSKCAPKLHVIVAEYVHQIQLKRKAAQRESRNKLLLKESAS